jgi:hypothetical protein
MHTRNPVQALSDSELPPIHEIVCGVVQRLQPASPEYL